MTAAAPLESTGAEDVKHAHKIALLVADWQLEEQPRLRRLLTVIAHELAASHERPGPDLEPAS